MIGVSALGRRSGARVLEPRPVYNDLAAPGAGDRLHLPAAADRAVPRVPGPGLLASAARPDYRTPRERPSRRRRSRRRPRLLLAHDPRLSADQVAALLERTADDANASNGCRMCAGLRDPLPAGGGSTSTAALNVARTGRFRRRPLRVERRRRLPLVHALGADADDRGHARLLGRPVDVYRVYCDGQTAVTLQRSAPHGRKLPLWKPGTQHGGGASRRARPSRACRPKPARRATCHRAQDSGWYYVEVEDPRRRAPAVPPAHLEVQRSRAVRPRARRAARAPGSRRRRARRHVLVTTAPAPTNASSPISIPGHSIAPPPIRAPRRIVGPISSCRFSVRPMQLSFVVTTHGAMNTLSSSVE